MWGFTYTWTLTNNVSEQAKERQTQTLRTDWWLLGDKGRWGTGGQGEGAEVCRMVVTVSEYEVQHRDHSH